MDVDDDGWRLGVGASFSPNAVWTFDAGYREEYGPGASSHGFEASISAVPLAQLTLTAYGSTLDRPLEFRFEEAGVDVLGLDAEWRPSDRLRLALGGAHYREDRRRPDASGIDWNQTRLHAGVTLFLGSGADRSRLPAGAPDPTSSGNAMKLRWVIVAVFVLLGGGARPEASPRSARTASTTGNTGSSFPVA